MLGKILGGVALVGAGVSVYLWGPTALKKVNEARDKVLAPESQRLYEVAMNMPAGKTPQERDAYAAKINKLADQFKAEGFKGHAANLKKRALLRTASPETKAKRDKIARAAMGSDDPAFVEKVAGIFEDMTAHATADKLMARAAALKAGRA